VTSFIRRNCDQLVLVLLALLLYLSFMSCSFDEWDSYNFAFALSQYDVERHRPHPPGFPLYVLLGRVMMYLEADPLVALATISVISGALMVLPIYALSHKMYGRPTAVLTCLALMFTPAVWILSEVALADMLFTFLLTSAISLLYFGIKGSPRLLQLSWLIYGLAIGVRPNPSALTPLALWITSTVLASKRAGKGVVVKGVFLFLVGLAAWSVPMISVVGWGRYLFVMRRQLFESSRFESAWAMTRGLDPVERFGHVIVQTLVFSLGGAFVGADPLFASTNPTVFLHGGLLILAIVACILNLRKMVGRLFLFLWIIPYFAFAYLFGTLGYPRYYLPIIPAIMIAVVPSMLALTKTILGNRSSRSRGGCVKAAVRFGLPTILVASFFINTLPLAVIIHTEPAPTKQLFDYVTANYPPGTAIVEYHEHRVFQFYRNEMRFLHSLFDRDKVMVELSRFSPEHTLLITTSAYEYLIRHPAIAELRVSKVVEFFRDPHVVVEDHRVALYKVTYVALK